MGTATCTSCGIEKPVTQFVTHRRKSGVRYYDCNECKRIKSTVYRDANREACLSRTKRAYKKLKREAFCVYSKGTYKCGCCKESRYEFLTLHHINGDGAEHRRTLDTRDSGKVYRDLKNRGWPPICAILCMNCNFALDKSGYCPHERERQSQLTTKEESYDLPLFAGLI